MFQTHAYDSWTAWADRNNRFWWLSRHIGGFPSRLFLLLAGVSLALRFDSDRRRGVDVTTSRAQAVRRGLEVLGYGLAFRVAEWILGGAGLWYARDILRVDILNCIGASLMLTAVVASPRDLEDGRLPWRPAAAALAVAFATPLLAHAPIPSLVPRPIAAYFWGHWPAGGFPLFPWASYVLTGAAVGTVLVQAARRDRLALAVLLISAVGLAMAVGGQLARRGEMQLYSMGDNANAPPSPTAYFYRTGVCLFALGLSYLATRYANPNRFSPMRKLGQASLLVYVVHVELVYGHLSDRIKHHLSLVAASWLLCALTLAMVALAYVRTEWLPARAARRARAPGVGG
jgi:uncharacterized membrane protein